ncbi:MAG: methylmalonyl-CoA mutase family protein [Fibromonadaceae bacterium]|jgi:methylmalonyl-CoA mutase|nr:methylmalonyl-CoA mutase family protein [Fibromonadaceae bacterium]
MKEKLFAEFPDVSTEEWEATINADLKGADYEKKLIWKTLEGISVKPYYRKADTDGISWLLNNLPGEFPFARGTKKTDNNWEIRENIYEENVAAANAAAKNALERGADAVCFLHGTEADIESLSAGIDPSKVHFDFVENNSVIKTHSYHNAGANIIQELSIALSAGLEQMDALTEAGQTAEQAAAQISFSISVGSRYFLEIAKIRALRILWANVLKGYGVTGTAKIHASTSMWNATVFDPNVNMLRVTTEAMSAAIAGADSITVIPFDAVFKKPDQFSCRIARNVQLLLKNECNFHKIVDPSAGSYYIETLTEQIASKALEAFKKIESEGGLKVALQNGSIQKAIDESWKQKEKLISQRREVFIGTNQYPNLQETMSDKITTELNIRRGPQVFEMLRLQTERSGKTPKVFLWTAGDLAMRLARATFIKNFFGCAGYTIIDTNGIPNAAEGLELVKKENPQIVVLCSKDEEYLDLVKEIFPALEKEFPNIVRIVAGNPKNAEDLKAVGAQDFIHVLTNAIESLSAYQKKLGVA